MPGFGCDSPTGAICVASEPLDAAGVVQPGSPGAALSWTNMAQPFLFLFPPLSFLFGLFGGSSRGNQIEIGHFGGGGRSSRETKLRTAIFAGGAIPKKRHTRDKSGKRVGGGESVDPFLETKRLAKDYKNKNGTNKRKTKSTPVSTHPIWSLQELRSPVTGSKKKRIQTVCENGSSQASVNASLPKESWERSWSVQNAGQGDWWEMTRKL